jgi:lauroyl/myristoyl acyltransferase
VTLRHALSWKSLFYDAILPGLRRLGPERSDAVLCGLGRTVGAWPARRAAMSRALSDARSALAADWDIEHTRRQLAANVARFLARDYLLEGTSSSELEARFDVQGAAHLHSALASGRGVVLVGCHLGAHIAAVHWLHRQDFALRLLVQRPRHVSRTLHNWFDRVDSPLPQSHFFLRRDLSAAEGSQRLLRAHAALRDGKALYLSGDVPWSSCNPRPGRLLGHERLFLGVWAELAILSQAPVIPVFCTHRQHGRYALTFDAPWHLKQGQESEAVSSFLARLEREIAAHPSDAVAHLTWPCYSKLAAPDRDSRRRSRSSPTLTESNAASHTSDTRHRSFAS